MSQFTTALVVSPLSDGKSWVVIKQFEYHVGAENSDDRIKVSEGFVTDFTSVPRIFWWIIPRWGKYGNAAVIHDWLYWVQRKEGSEGRREADYILNEAMGVLGVGKYKRKIIFKAVRWFGWLAWLHNEADKASGFDRVIETQEIKATSTSKRPRAMMNTYKYYKNKKQNIKNLP